MSGRKRSFLKRYGISTLAVCLTLALRYLLHRWDLVSQDVPYLLFFIPVTVAAWIGGLGPGIFATALSALCNQYFFLEPYLSFSLGKAGQPLQLVLFAMEGVGASLICTRMNRARRRAELNAREARELERRILEIGDAEQRRIGHDLHDGLGQHLTGIALMTQQLEHRLSAEGSPLAPRASKINALAEKAVEWTHDLSRSLASPALESEGLAQGLDALAANAENIFGITCRLEQDVEKGPDDLAAAVHLYRIAQEAISNAVKHGRAKNVALRLVSFGDEFRMEIEDDGSGIQPEQKSPDGMGLRIMRYRARMIGATIEVEHNGKREKGKTGTRIVCRYNPAERDGSEDL